MLGQANSTGFDVWVDNVSLQPFTQEEWESHQFDSIEKVRKGRVVFEVVNGMGEPVADAVVTIKQKEPHFPFGCAMNGLIVKNQHYRDWFLSKGFKYSVFENELKWKFTEVEQGVVNYSLPDAMLEFANNNNITVRGHNILWDDPTFQSDWQKNVSSDKLREATFKRVNSVVTKYRGRFIHWDVINENMHYNLYSSLTNNGTDVYKLVHKLDPLPVLFINEFNVIEASSVRGSANPWNYLQKVEQIRNAGYDGPLGIGLEGHFVLEPNYPFIRASIDVLHAAALPIWITEFDVDIRHKPWMLKYLDPLLRELHSHPFVDAIILWSALGDKPSKDRYRCYQMCLTDENYENVAAGDIVDAFMKDVIRVADTNRKTDGVGVFEVSLFLGEYEAVVALPNGAQPPASRTFTLTPGREDTVVRFKAW